MAKRDLKTGYTGMLRHSKRSKISKICPEDLARESISTHSDPEGFEIDVFIFKGRGVRATQSFDKGAFLLCYYGDLISEVEGEEREEKNSTGYRFFFKHGGRSWCADASNEPVDKPFLGRLVNHGQKRECNCRMKVVFVDVPYLCLFATRDIHPGEELLYDYGLAHYPWDTKVNRKSAEDSCSSTKSSTSEFSKSKKISNQELDRICDGNTKLPPNGVPTIQQDAAPTIQQDVVPTIQQDVVPTIQQDVVPTIQQDAVPTIQQDVVPSTEQQDVVPTIQQDVVPTIRQDVVPTIQQDVVPTIQQDVVPSTEQQDVVPTIQQDVVPAIQQDVVPTIQQDAVPSTEQQDVVPTIQQDAVPTIRQDVVPTIQQDAVPTIQQDVVPTIQQDVVPTIQQDVVPTIQQDVVPTIQQDVVPTIQQDVVPTIQQDVVPTIQQDVVPTIQQDAVPTIQQDVVPTEQQDTVPTKQQDAVQEVAVGQQEPLDKRLVETFVHDDEESFDDDTCDPDYTVENSGESDESVESDLSIIYPAITEVKSMPVILEKDKRRPKKMSPSGSGMLSTSVTVQVSKNSKTKRIWNKQQYCVFCEKPISKLPRHLVQKHKSEAAVGEIMAHKLGSPERKRLLDKLRNKGNFNHNMDILQSGTGEILPYKRPRSEDKYAAKDYSPCEYCLRFVVSDNLWKHQKKCLQKSVKEQGRNRNVKAKSALLLPSSVPGSSKSSQLMEVLQNMNTDTTHLVVRNDSLILKYGEKILKVGGEQHNRHYIAQKMRELGRLLITVRSLSKDVMTLHDVIMPSRFSLVVTAVKSVAGFDDKSKVYRIPSLALKLGASLKKCSKIVKAEALIEGNDSKAKEADHFYQVCDMEWGDQVSSVALKTLREGKWKKPEMMPLVQDVVLLHKYLQQNAKLTREALDEQISTEKWYELGKMVLTMIILFNRRRSGEASRIKVENFTNMSTRYNEDVTETLTKFEKQLCKVLHRFVIKGKRGRKVPVLLTEEMKAHITFLMETRDCVEIMAENVYLFPIPNSENYVRGSDCLRKYADVCGAKHPNFITSTRLRKQIGILSQLFCLKDNELDVLAKFMGHDIRVHREYYRLTEDTLQLAKVSKILIALERGKLSDVAGQTLDEIQIDINTVEDESSTDESCDDGATGQDGDDTDQNEDTGSVHTEEADNTGNVHTEQADHGEAEVSQYTATRQRPEKPKAKKVYWTPTEKLAVQKHLNHYIRQMTVPGKLDCDKCIRQEPVLARRNWKDVKNYIHNTINSNKRKLKR